MEKISLADRVRNKKLLVTVKEDRNILHKMKKTANWFGHILRRNWLINYVIKRKEEGRL